MCITPVSLVRVADGRLIVPFPPRASGHVDRFSDFMVKDVETGDCYRADHLLADHIERLLADPKCPPEKAKEYQADLNQVWLH